MKTVKFTLLTLLSLALVACNKPQGQDGDADPNAVDLGLSVKWAKCNIGAMSPEESGGHYAWGEIELKKDYDWPTYKWCNGDLNKLTKYCTNNKADQWDGLGSPDGITTLEQSDDVSHVKLGGKWRTPTIEEWLELKEKCTWEWSSQNGVNGYLITASNCNSIFLPTAGFHGGTAYDFADSYGFYWSSSLDTVGAPDGAWYVVFDSSYIEEGSYTRSFGLSIRPVTE